MVFEFYYVILCDFSGDVFWKENKELLSCNVNKLKDILKGEGGG